VRSLLLALSFVALSLLTMALAVAGARSGWWDVREGVGLLRWGTYGAVVGALWTVLAAAGVWWPASRRRRPQPPPRRGAVLVALAVALVAVRVAVIPWQWQRRASLTPAIHDVSTDLADPPQFVAVLPRRGPAANPPDYGGPEVAYLQRSAYADIAPLTLLLPPAAAFDRALTVARAMGWEIVAADRATGRIEATDRTPWFRLPEDVVVRVRPSGTGARVDVRSQSRFGLRDAATNAERVREYLARVKAAR